MSKDKTQVYFALERFRDAVIEKARANLSAKGKNASGGLSEALEGEMQVMENSIRVFFDMPDYGWYQDKGVQGVKSNYVENKDTTFSYKSKGGKKGLKGMPPPNKFSKWIRTRNIKGRDAKTGRFITNKSLQFLIARSIFHKGIKASMFFTKPFEQEFEKLGDELKDAYGLDVIDLFQDIMSESLDKK